MLEFIQLIKQRYQTILMHVDKNHPQSIAYQQRHEQLLYAEAFIRKGQLIANYGKFPIQIAVIGPTQSGKSSIVNCLLNMQLASVSPLAGFTIHPHGYSHSLNSEQYQGLQSYFGRFQCLDVAMLSRNRYDCYSLTQITSCSDILPACICWDTPDFDSINSNDYREGVIRTIALADIIILVVSKEKYADQSVWELMKMIAPFQQPTLICLNKINEDNKAALTRSLQQKWQQYRSDPLPEIVSFLWQKTTGNPLWPKDQRQAVFKLSKKIAHQQHHARQLTWLQQYCQQWLEPIDAEHQAQQSWQQLVDQCLLTAELAYQRDYLNHPYHNASFKTALVNLLTLLEIPGIAKAISKTRHIMTWPLRKIMGVGRWSNTNNPGSESLILKLLGEHIMIQLADQLLEKNASSAQPTSWWQETAKTLRLKRSAILYDYNLAVDDYHLNFQTAINDAAEQLYQKLQEQPMVLNSLRATRATSDVASLLLAVQAGGIGLHDLLLAPVMLSISSMLTESAIGHYMQRVEAELKQKQLQTVKNQIFKQCLQQWLYQLPDLIQSPDRFNISPQQCQQFTMQLKEKKSGLRLINF